MSESTEQKAQYETPSLITHGTLADLTQGSGGECTDAGTGKSAMHKFKRNGKC